MITPFTFGLCHSNLSKSIKRDFVYDAAFIYADSYNIDILLPNGTSVIKYHCENISLSRTAPFPGSNSPKARGTLFTLFSYKDWISLGGVWYMYVIGLHGHRFYGELSKYNDSCKSAIVKRYWN